MTKKKNPSNVTSKVNTLNDIPVLFNEELNRQKKDWPENLDLQKIEIGKLLEVYKDSLSKKQAERNLSIYSGTGEFYLKLRKSLEFNITYCSYAIQQLEKALKELEEKNTMATEIQKEVTKFNDQRYDVGASEVEIRKYLAKLAHPKFGLTEEDIDQFARANFKVCNPPASKKPLSPNIDQIHLQHFFYILLFKFKPNTSLKYKEFAQILIENFPMFKKSVGDIAKQWSSLEPTYPNELK